MFKIKDYILVPKDIPVLGKLFLSWSHYTDWLGVLILILYFIVFGWLFNMPGEPLFFIGFILAIIYWGINSRVSIALALFGLICIPVLLILFNKEILMQGEIWAEQAAVWVYYFLVIGVVKQIFEYREDQKKKLKSKKLNKNNRKVKQHIVDLRRL